MAAASDIPSVRNPWPIGLVTGLVLLGLGALGILFLFPPDQFGFYPRCGLYLLTGLQCPGCGSLRALHHMTHGRWIVAFHHNPILVIVVPAAIAYALGCWLAGRPWLPETPRARRVAFWAGMIALILFTIGRNLALLISGFGSR